MPDRVARRVVTQQLLANGLREIALLGRLHGKSQLNQIDYSIQTIGAVRHDTVRNALLPGMQRHLEWDHTHQDAEAESNIVRSPSPERTGNVGGMRRLFRAVGGMGNGITPIRTRKLNPI